MRRRRQTANIPNLTHSKLQNPQHMAAADIRYEMRPNPKHPNWVTSESLMHSESRLYNTVGWALIWLLKTGFWGPGAS